MSSHNALVVTLILTISLMAQSLPERDADAWNEIGEEIGEEIGKVLVCKETDQGCQNLAAQACPADYKLQNNANTKVDGKFLDHIVTIKYEGKNYVLCKNAGYDANGNPIFCQSGMWGTKSIKVSYKPAIVVPFSSFRLWQTWNDPLTIPPSVPLDQNEPCRC